MARNDRRTVVKSREKARSNAFTRKTIQASQNKPLTQTGSAGKGGGKGPPKTPAAVSDPSKGKGVARRTGVTKASAKRGERLVGSGTATKKTLPGAKSAAKAASKKLTAAGALGRLSVVAAGASEIKRTVDQKRDTARPTVKEHAANASARRAKLKQHDFNPEKTAAKKAQTAASKKWVNEFGAKTAAKNAKTAASKKWVNDFSKRGGDQTSAPAAKTAAKAGGTKKRGGYSYTGPKVGSDEYKAMRKAKHDKRKASAFAKTKTGKAQAARKSATTARQQGTTAPNYQQPVTRRPGSQGHQDRQSTYTGDSATTNANLAKAANSDAAGGGEERGYWNKKLTTQGNRTRREWLMDRMGN